MSNLQQTHHDECWRQRRHHDCAVGKIERQARRIAELKDVLNKLDLLACKADDANMVRLIRAVTENNDE